MTGAFLLQSMSIRDEGYCVQVLDVLCAVAEYDELPVRHNEDKLNMTLSASVRFPISEKDADDPHAKAKLLLQVSHPSVLNKAFSPSLVMYQGWHLCCVVARPCVHSFGGCLGLYSP